MHLALYTFHKFKQIQTNVLTFEFVWIIITNVNIIYNIAIELYLSKIYSALGAIYILKIFTQVLCSVNVNRHETEKLFPFRPSAIGIFIYRDGQNRHKVQGNRKKPSQNLLLFPYIVSLKATKVNRKEEYWWQ